METKVEYDGIEPMEKDMERTVVRALKLHTKDVCIITADKFNQLVDDYKEKYGYEPAEWEAYRQRLLGGKS